MKYFDSRSQEFSHYHLLSWVMVKNLIEEKLGNEILFKTENTCLRGIYSAIRHTVLTYVLAVQKVELCFDLGLHFLK